MPQDAFYLDAFWALTTCRRYAGGRIPWIDIVAFADRRGLESDVQDAFISVIEALDVSFLEWVEDSQPKPGTPTQHSGGRVIIAKPPPPPVRGRRG